MKIISKQKYVKDKDIELIQKKYNISKDLAKFLLGRKLKEDIVEALLGEYLLPKHNNITNLEEGATLIASFLEKENASIYVYADYDADGINAGFIASDCLTKIKEATNSLCDVEVYFPNRTDGYGLSLEWCKKLVEKNKIEKKEILVMTVDNGITKKIETEYLLQNNIEVLITDHHHPKEGEVPEDVLVIDPWLHNDKDSLGLCGTGVAYKLFAYLLENIYQDDSKYHLFYLPHVAIATITDIMPLTIENIHYVKYGLYLIEHDYCVKGIQYYKERKSINTLSTKEIAFSLGPQLNACGRMFKTEAAGNFLLADEDEEVIDTYNIISKINDERKKFQSQILEDIFETIEVKNDTKFIIAHVEEIGGVGGVIAAKITEKYGLPCMVLGGKGDLLHGSARSIGNLDLFELFIGEVEKGNILNFGGHKGAAGVEVDKTKLNKLKSSLEERLKDVSFDIENNEVDEIMVDEIITLKDINKNKIDIFNGIPFINTLEEPVFAIKDLEVFEWTASKNNPENLCLTVMDNITKATKKIWVWGFTSKYKEMNTPTKIHLIGNIERDFMNIKNYTLSVKNVIPAI